MNALEMNELYQLGGIWLARSVDSFQRYINLTGI